MFKDIIKSLSKIRILIFLSFLEIKYKYTRTSLGAFWNTIAALVFIFIVSKVYSGILNENNDDLFLYSSIGYIFWILCSSVITESMRILIDNEGILKDIKINIIDLVLRQLIKNLIIFLHNSIIIIIGMIVYLDGLNLINIFVFIINFFILISILFFSSIFFAFIALIYRDVIQLVSTLMFLLFLITPIFWKSKIVIDMFFVKYNPFYYIVDIIRSPLLNQEISLNNFYIVLLILLFSVFAAALCYKKNKQIFYLL